MDPTANPMEKNTGGLAWMDRWKDLCSERSNAEHELGGGAKVTGNPESLKLELLKLQYVESYARSQEARAVLMRSLAGRARARIVCGIIQLALFAGLFAVGVFILLTV